MSTDPSASALIEPRDSAPIPLEQCFVFSRGRLRANANGRKRFGDRFARAGFDINKIRTFDELEAALEGSWHVVMSVESMARDFEELNAGKDSLAHRAVRARLHGDAAEVDRIHRKMDRIKNSRLRVVGKGKTPSRRGQDG